MLWQLTKNFAALKIAINEKIFAVNLLPPCVTPPPHNGLKWKCQNAFKSFQLVRFVLRQFTLQPGDNL